MIIKYKGHNKLFYWNKALTVGKEYEADVNHIFLDDNGTRVMWNEYNEEYFTLTGSKQDAYKQN